MTGEGVSEETNHSLDDGRFGLLMLVGAIFGLIYCRMNAVGVSACVVLRAMGYLASNDREADLLFSEVIVW